MTKALHDLLSTPNLLAQVKESLREKCVDNLDAIVAFDRLI